MNLNAGEVDNDIGVRCSPECSYCSGSGWIEASKQPRTLMPCPTMAEKTVAGFLNSTAPKPIRDALIGRKLVPGFCYRSLVTGPIRSARVRIDPSPYAESHGFPIKDQLAVLAEMGKHPFRGYAFYGPTGTGKTLLLFALAQEWVYAFSRVYYCTSSRLAAAIDDGDREYLGELPCPDPWMGRPSLVIIDEIDSIPRREAVLRFLFDLLSHCYNAPDKCVVSIASNAPPKMLKSIIGDAAHRRIEDLCVYVNTGGDNGR